MKILLPILMIVTLVSCGQKEEQGVVEESVEIIDGYVDTLEGSVQDARAVKKLLEAQQQDLKNNLR